MVDDLKVIKKKYGEKMMHLCRDLFPTLLETKGLLLNLLTKYFNESHFLYDDLKRNDLFYKFKEFIYSKATSEEMSMVETDKTPAELLKEAGYILYECKTEEEIQTFRKYYAKNEALCSFRLNRLKDHYVFFAVKENVDEIKREDFIRPQRQDAYGTSVISIQFSKDGLYTLSIKNRYNHHVSNADATFSNNLDNIIPGLTYSFEKHFGILQKHKNMGFEIPGYIRAKDGKFYKYNYEIRGIFYCPDNIIINKNFEVIQLSKERFIVADYFILDLANKCLIFDKNNKDSFPGTIPEIKKITVTSNGSYREINIFPRYDDAIIKIFLDAEGKIIAYRNDWAENVGRFFMYLNKSLVILSMNHLKNAGDYFLFHNDEVKKVYLSALESLGNNCLTSAGELQTLQVPALKSVGNSFLTFCHHLQIADFPNLKIAGDNFLRYDEEIKSFSAPLLEAIGTNFLSSCYFLENFDAPRLMDNSSTYQETIKRLLKRNQSWDI